MKASFGFLVGLVVFCGRPFIVSAHWREIAGKELGPQPGGNVREANSDRRKEAMCAVV
jgi:hypothetical protein